MSNMSSFTPRKGQQDLIEYLPQIKAGDILSVQWPTGYGKSIGFALTWKHCQEKGIANRFLLVVANDTQRQQIINDFAGDCKLVDAPCPGGVWSFERSAGDLRMAKLGDVTVFVSTVQQLEASVMRGGLNTLKDMLQMPGTRWMIGFDEYHHYGEAMAWGESAKLAMQHAAFTLAMSATPYRRGADTVFPEPTLAVTYKEAVDAKCLKPMVCHSYEYAVAVIQDGEEVANYTTTELYRIADGEIDKWEERRGIRYSPQYFHPLILHPLRRLRESRALTGKRLQMLIRAMSCGHAKMICEQVRKFADGLNVDWIGTGDKGRSDKDNRNILEQFCPKKGLDGQRPQPSIDVLVQVAMAGEGFDSVNVCEIVDLFPVSSKALSGRATQDKQFYGRGARIVKGAEDVPVYINVPSDHPLHAWAGRSLASWMDTCGDAADPSKEKEISELNKPDLFEFPALGKDRDIQLLTVITDHEMFRSFSKHVCKAANHQFSEDQLVEFYLKAANKHAMVQNEQARAFQVREYIDSVVGRIALVKSRQTEEISGALIGRFKKEVNTVIKKQFGRSRDEMTSEELEVVANWLRNYLHSMKGLGL